MEVKPGYKQTEAGTIPEDWQTIRFSEFMEFQNGANADKSAYGSGLRFINVLEVITKSHLRAKDIPGRVELSKSRATAYAVRRGDIVFNRTSETQEEVGLSAVYVGDESVVFGGFVIRGRPKDERLHTIYAGYGLRAPLIRRQIVARGQGAIRANIGQADLKTVWVSLPTKAEQEAIAEALSDADALIESLEQLVAKKRQLNQAAMQELLTGKKRLPGFTGEWEVKRLRDLGSFLKGSGVTRDEARSGNLACVQYGEIYTRHNDYIKAFHSWISPDVAAKATRLKQGDILFAGSGETKGEIGKCAAFVADLEAYAGGDIVILRAEESDPLFLGYYLNTEPINRQKASKGQGDAVVHISSSALADVHVTVPLVPEQTAIAAILSDMDAAIAALEAKLAKARQLGQGMMQELLTGRIRLV